MVAGKPIVILGVFVADTAYRAGAPAAASARRSLGDSFKLGPGGKGSNQAVAAGRLGADVTFLTRLGRDAFADMAQGDLGGGGRQCRRHRDAAKATPGLPISSSRTAAAKTPSSSRRALPSLISTADIDGTPS